MPKFFFFGPILKGISRHNGDAPGNPFEHFVEVGVVLSIELILSIVSWTMVVGFANRVSQKTIILDSCSLVSVSFELASFALMFFFR